MGNIMKIPEESISNKSAFWTFLPIALIAIIPTLRGYAHEEHSEQSPNNMEARQPVQTTCPVLAGKPIDKNIYTDYKGKRVYFCCNSCKATFEKDPDKYLTHLPQFASALQSDHNHASREHDDGLIIPAGLVVPMGIITLSLVGLTVALSLFRRLNVRLMMRWHKRAGIAALISGAIHATLVLLAH